MSTYFPKEGDIVRKWYVVDATGQALGRLASQVARILMGKESPKYTPFIDAGDHVVVINAEKVKLTGKKWQIKLYRDHSLFPGGLQTKTAAELLARHPADLIKRAVWGMLPKGPLGRRIYKKLKVYTGAEHPHAAQQPKPLKLA